MGSSTDFDFLCRDRRVHHRKLATRLAGVNDWYEFDGTSSTRSIMAGFGNVEDNMLEDPHGPYRAAALRGFDATHQLWRIWWLDLRFPTEIGVPVAGAFDGDGVSPLPMSPGRKRPSSCALSGTTMLEMDPAGSRRFPLMTAGIGKPTGQWTSHGDETTGLRTQRLATFPGIRTGSVSGGVGVVGANIRRIDENDGA
jgi:hypothetical protein